MKLAFLGFAEDTNIVKFGEDSADVSALFYLDVAVDEDVVEVNHMEDVKLFVEGVVHEGLEGGWGIGEAKRPDQVLE